VPARPFLGVTLALILGHAETVAFRQACSKRHFFGASQACGIAYAKLLFLRQREPGTLIGIIGELKAEDRMQFDPVVSNPDLSV